MRISVSATQAGLSLPSTSTVRLNVIWTAWSPIYSTFSSVTRWRMRLPTGTGAGKRTLLRP
jgi:hypothetical protein